MYGIDSDKIRACDVDGANVANGVVIDVLIIRVKVGVLDDDFLGAFVPLDSGA